MKIVIKKVKNITSGFNVNTLSFDTKKGCDIYYEV